MRIDIYRKYTCKEIWNIIGGNLLLIGVIAKEWSKRENSGIKNVNGTWFIPGGEIKAIQNEMRERENEC